MGIINPMVETVSHLKAIFYGPQGSGKTYTACELACGVHQFFKCKNPIVFIDTEGGARFRKTRAHELTGMVPNAVFTRRMDELMTACREIDQGAAEVVVIDSVTHFWQGLSESYKASLAQRFRKSVEQIHLTLDDIGKIKDAWQPFNRWLVETSTHVVICGRMGYTWDDVEDDRGHMKLTKTGTKVKAEGEFGHEPDYVFEMSLIQEEHPHYERGVKEGRIITAPNKRSAVKLEVVKERWDILQGEITFDPTFNFFKPIVTQLRPREAPPIDTDPGVMDLGDDGRQRWRVDKSITLENIELAVARAFPSTRVEDKTAKLDVLDATFGTMSWEEIKVMPLELLKQIMPVLKTKMHLVKSGQLAKSEAITQLAEYRDTLFKPVEQVDPDQELLDVERNASEMFGDDGKDAAAQGANNAGAVDGGAGQPADGALPSVGPAKSAGT